MTYYKLIKTYSIIYDWFLTFYFIMQYVITIIITTLSHLDNIHDVYVT